MEEKKLKKVISGELFHEIEEFGGKKYEHMGFRDEKNKFGDMLSEIVPEIGMIKKVKITIEML